MVENTDAATPAKKSKATKAKKPKIAPTHPPVSKMVTSAIATLKERNGSSLAAIKKYISSNYKVDADKLSAFIRKFIKSAVSNGILVQTKGKGANGSFKINTGTKETTSAAKPKKLASAKPNKAKPASPKKSPKPKKAAAKPKKATTAKKAKPAKKAASPKKPKPVKLAAKPKSKSSPKKKVAAKKGKK